MRVTLPGDVPPEIMYARFAWAVIEQAGPATLKDLPVVSPAPGAALEQAPVSGSDGVRLFLCITVHKHSQAMLVEDDDRTGEDETEENSPLTSRQLSPSTLAAEKFPHLRTLAR